MTAKLPVIPATCGDCDSFDPWNDGSCTIAELGYERLSEEGETVEPEFVNAEKREPPPPNCPKRHACPTCGRFR